MKGVNSSLGGEEALAFSEGVGFFHKGRQGMKFIVMASLACLLAATICQAAGKPLKVYLLAGQSNMQGQGHVSTFPYLGMDQETEPMLKKMVDTNGQPRMIENVWISSLGTGTVEKFGQLTLGYGSERRSPKIGPELTFGIYMQEYLGEPILLIKTSWGGKSLCYDFRPPSAGAHPAHTRRMEVSKAKGEDTRNAEAEYAERAGKYYRLMIGHAKSVLADIKRVVPGYDPAQGYEVAGFVWLQGCNDFGEKDTYPNPAEPGGFDEYSRLLACLIRDIRQELCAPEMCAVIGVIGLNGELDTERVRDVEPQHIPWLREFRKAMAAPAALPEFRGRVAAVYTEHFWEPKLEELQCRWKKVKEKSGELKKAGLGKDEQQVAMETFLKTIYNPQELKLMQVGVSNATYHYLGSAKIMARMGKAFAEAMADMDKRSADKQPELNPWADHGIPSRHGFGAWYTRKSVAEEWHQVSRSDEFADVMVRFPKNTGEMLFWRGTSYLPCWNDGGRSFPFEEVIPRTGDGPAGRPDKINRYASARIIESTPQQVIVHWRYMPKMPVDVGPQNLPDQTQLVDEYFVVCPDQTILRAVLPGQSRYEAWRASAPGKVFRYKLTQQGIDSLPVQSGDKALLMRVMGFDNEKVRVLKPAPLCQLPADMPKPLAAFSFDEGTGTQTVERISGTRLAVEGHAAYWRTGVSGTALLLDGYTSQVSMEADFTGKVSRGLTLDAWVCISAYPWNTCPVVQQLATTPDGMEERDGFMLAIEADGKPSLWATVHGQRVTVKGDQVLPRTCWLRLTGVAECGDDKSTLRLYVDDTLAAESAGPAGSLTLPGRQPLRIGQGIKRMPARPVGRGQYPTQYAFEGLLDEVAVYPVALTREQLAASGKAFALSPETRSTPALEPRVLPTGEKGWNTFAARFTRLTFHQDFDQMFRFCGHPDIVVTFDKMPCRYVFWHGAGYIPMLVTENGRWYSNEFNENAWKGCCEPMSDKKALFGQMQILEQSPARVVLKWRYPLSEVGYRIAFEDAASGWGIWADWYFVIYPDGTVLKRMRVYMDQARRHEWQESMAIMGPEQRPESVIDTIPALTLVTTNGSVREYSWIEAPPKRVDYSGAILHVVNMKATYDPYTVQRIAGGDIYGARGGTGYSAFPAWNHWPTAQFLSDGRHAIFPDRTAHSSLTHIVWNASVPFGTQGMYEEKLLLEGLSDRPPKDLLPLAKSWLQPAQATSLTKELSVVWNAAERAYSLTRGNAGVQQLRIALAGANETPLVNPVLVVENWGSDKLASITLDGRPPAAKTDIRQGIVTRANGVNALVVWFEKSSHVPLEIGLDIPK